MERNSDHFDSVSVPIPILVPIPIVISVPIIVSVPILISVFNFDLLFRFRLVQRRGTRTGMISIRNGVGDE